VRTLPLDRQILYIVSWRVKPLIDLTDAVSDAVVAVLGSGEASAGFTYLTDERLQRAKREGTIPDLARITVESLKQDVLASQARVAAQIKAGGPC
jgi:hypothetical protein